MSREAFEKWYFEDTGLRAVWVRPDERYTAATAMQERLWRAWQAALQSGEPVAFPGWKSVKTQPPTEEDGIILIWAENMPISVGECGDSGDYLFRECEDWGQCFEGDINWLKEHWELWMHMPEPHSKLYTTPQPVVPEAEALARMFHETYESLAEVAGYETRLETRSFNLESPNGRLMVLVCAEIRKAMLSAGKETV
jgi:hypothetical protein